MLINAELHHIKLLADGFYVSALLNRPQISEEIVEIVERL